MQARKLSRGIDIALFDGSDHFLVLLGGQFELFLHAGRIWMLVEDLPDPGMVDLKPA